MSNPAQIHPEADGCQEALPPGKEAHPPGKEARPPTFCESSDPIPWWRAIAARIAQHPDFELVIVLLVLCNCISLACYAPTKVLKMLAIWSRPE